MRIRHKVKKGSIAAALIVLVVVLAIVIGFVFSTKTIRASYDIQLTSLRGQIEESTHQVYVATSDIPAGKVITEDMLTLESHLITQAENLFSVEDFGCTSLVDIPAGTVITEVLVTTPNDENTSRVVEYTCLHLSASLEEGSFVDVRIRFQNGEDFVVLSKKQIHTLSLAASSCYLVVTEKEQQLMASAIIDMKEHDAVLYTTAYVEPTIQDASFVSYPARSETIALIDAYDKATEGEWLRNRGELEIRLGVTDGDYNGTGRAPIDISNFTKPNESNTANNNDTGVVGAGGATSGEESTGAE